MIDSTLIQKFDLFQVTIPISYKNSHTYQSKIGGILTIISFLIIIIYFFIKVSILFDRSSFVITTNEYHDLGGSINLTSTPILLQLLDKKGNSMDYDTKLFSFNVFYIQTIFENVNGVTKRKNEHSNVEVERCDKLKKFFPVLNDFPNFNLTQFMCIKPNENQNLILSGIADDLNSNYKSLEVKVNKCKGSDCYNSKIIENIMDNSIFTVSYLGYTTNFTDINVKRNIVNKIYTRYITLSLNLIKKITYGFSKGKLNLYDNMITNNKIEFNYFTYKDFVSDFFIRNSEDDDYYYADFYFNYNGHMVEHIKKVNGLGSIILDLCTVVNMVILIARIINNYYGNKILFSDIYFDFLMKNGRLRKLSRNLHKNEGSISIYELLNKSINKSINNIIVGNINSNNNNVNNINLCNYRNSFKGFNYLNDNKVNKKNYDYTISRNGILKFYFYPYCLLKTNKKLYQIKEQVSIIFSIENFFDVLQISNSSRNILNEQIFKYISNENNGKTVSKDNEQRSDMNLKSLYKNNIE